METRKNRRKKRKSPLKKVFLTLLGILLVFIIGAGVFLGKMYFDAKGTVNQVTEPATERQYPAGKGNKDNIKAGKPFSVLLLGLDTGDLGRDEQGRSDTIMVATVNPSTKQTTLVSIARDTYTEIIGHGTTDKINHAYAFGGVSMAMDSVENLLDVPIDHYVAINMKGLKELVDAVGGIQVVNGFAFEQDGFTFNEGTISLNGEQALAFSRMRYQDAEGDYGRQKRQRQVVSGILKQAMSLSTLTTYQDILASLENNMKTDLSWDELVKISTNYRSALTTIEQENLQGEGFMQDGVSYQAISDEEMQRVRDLLKTQLK